MMANSHKFLDEVSRYAAKHGWLLTLVRDGQAPESWSGDGALVSFSRSVIQMDYIRKLVATGIPAVGMSYTEPSLVLPRVVPDYEGSARAAAAHLVSKGFANFAFVTSERLDSGEIAYYAFKKAILESGLSNDVPWIVRREVVEKYGSDEWSAMTKAFRRTLCKLPRPLGVWCQSDSVAMQIIDIAIASKTKVPEEMGILGTNDTVVICENAEIPISSVHSDYPRMARVACERLEKMMEGDKEGPELVKIPPIGVMERDSTDVLAGAEGLLPRVMEYLSSHLREGASIPAMAKAMHVSHSRLSHCFHDQLKSTPTGELRKLRIKKAKKLMRSTDCSLDFVAIESGFCHSSHLVNAFRREEGITPAAWRQAWCG